jgi:hypothetical protein
MTTVVSKTPQGEWREGYAAFVRSVDEDYPETIRAELRRYLDAAERRFHDAVNPSEEDVEAMLGGIALLLPLPLAEIASSTGYGLFDLDDLVRVLAAELVELRARVATLEEAQS